MAVKVHVNQLVIRQNIHAAEKQPPLSIIRKGKVTRAHRVKLIGLSEVVYSPDKPLKCGARVWIEAEDVEIVR